MNPDFVSYFSPVPHLFVTLAAQILGCAALMAAIIQSRLQYSGGSQSVVGLFPYRQVRSFAVTAAPVINH
jgi:hypothetical protein